jgi:Transposase DDE domain
MAHATLSPTARQVAQLRRQFADTPGLPFAGLLDDETVRQALRDEGHTFRDRLFGPLVTLWVFLSQALDPDHSCRAAVARFLAWRGSQGHTHGSTDTGAYCRARGRLPEGVLARLVRSTGKELQDQAPAQWRWNGRAVKVVDGTTVSMPDTPANQRDYPQSNSQKPGVGFPLVRLAVLFSLTVGTVLEAALAPYRGKQTGEPSLFRTLHDALDPGDILLADRCYCSYWELATAVDRGWDAVMRLHQQRRADFRCGRRLGRDDHVVVWRRPPRAKWMDEAAYRAMPLVLAVREVRVRVRHPGFRTRTLVVATTLLDAAAFPREDIAILYRIRWHVELDLRDLKQTLQMDVLRGHSPEIVRKELWAHLLGYNLLRGLMAQSALAAGLLPLQISFKAALQVVNAFAAVPWRADQEELERLLRELRGLIARELVGDRPNRYEPRARKRRPKPYPNLNEPRDQARRRSRTRR